MKNKCKSLLKNQFTTIVIAIFFGFFIGGLFLIASGYNPIKSYGALIGGIFSRPKYIMQVIIKSTPLILTGLSVAFAFKTGLFNIGAEGQYVIGVLTATIIGTKMNLPPVIHFLFVILVTIITSGFWGSLAGFLKVKFDINEVVSSIMLNWIAFYIYKYIFYMPWLLVKSTDASQAIKSSALCTILQNFETSPKGREIINNSATLSDIFKTDLNYGIFIAIFIVFIVNYLLYKTTKGYEFRAIGINPNASKFVGINVKNNIILAMFIAGSISGIAGALQVTGVSPYKMINLSAFEGYGNEGIYIALVANSSPIGCILSGLFFGAIKSGSSTMQAKVGTPQEIIKIITGLIIFMISISSVYKIISNYMNKRKQAKMNEK